MRDLIKESILELKNSKGFIYVTEEGKQISLEEAAAKKISITPVHPKDEVLKKLENAGLFLTDTKFLNDLNELISILSFKKVSPNVSKRKHFTPNEKSKILEEWKKVEALGKSNKSAFAKEIGVGYQTFMNWLKS